MLDFNLRQLEVFAAAAEYGSFTAAAQALYLTQSTVSAHIQTLERALETQLFTRDVRKKICLTEAGRILYPQVQEILERCQALHAAVHPDDLPAVLSLAASTVPCKCLLPALMADFLKRRPECRYLLKKGDSAQVHRWLLAQEARIGFVGAKLEPARCRYYPLLRDKLVLLTANDEHFRSLQHAGVLGRELLTEPMVVREEGSGTRQRFDAYLERIGFDPQALRIVARIEQPDAILSIVASGVGVTVCSELAAHEQLSSGRLLAFELDAGSLYRELYLATEQHAALTPLEKSFLALILQQYPSA